MSHLRTMLFTVLVGLLAGCGSTANSDPQPSATQTGAVAELPATPATAATEATEATEVPPTGAPTTLAPLPVPTSATAIVLTPVAMLGWWDGHTWIDGDGTSAEIPVVPGATFSEIGIDQPVSTATAGGIVDDCETIGTFTVSLDPPLIYEFDADTSSVAVNSTWPLQPRPVTPIDLADPNSAGVVQAQLVAAGIPTSPVNVVQVFSADLDGDGATETVVTARHPDANTTTGPRAGWYYIVLLVQGGVTSVLASDVHIADDDSYPNGVRLAVDAIADLNGDGRMEIVVGDQEFEGAGATVVEIPESGIPINVLTGGCGS